jgi:hypothetical protein
MIYHFSLQIAALIAGAILCLLGAVGFAMEGSARNALATFPRSRSAGIVLLAIDLVWSFWLVSTMEMGEFSAFRRPFLFALPVGFFLTMRFVDEFLAVRALGISLRIESARAKCARLSPGRARSDLGNGALQIARSNQLVQQNHCALAWHKRFCFCLGCDANRSRISLLLNASSSFAAARLAISF